jgi:hypothetical protein
MRVFEVVEHHAADVKRVVALGSSADLLEQLGLPEGIETATADDGAARADDLVVVEVPADEEAVAGLADAVAEAGLQVVEASPVVHPTVTVAVVARRADGGTLSFVPYLGRPSRRRGPAEPVPGPRAPARGATPAG